MPAAGTAPARGLGMNRRNAFLLGLVVTSLTVVGCAAGDEPVEESAVGESSDALITVGSSSGETTGGTGTISTAKPATSTAACVSACLSTRISTGWCKSYCDCRVLDKGSVSYCERIASEFFIDI